MLLLMKETDEVEGVGDDKKQDLHAMIGVILERLKPYFERVFLWDQRCKGKLYKDVHYLLYIPYVKCDTKEAEDLCGKYGTRTGNVKCLCRYCDIPLKKGDRHLHKCTYKKRARHQENGGKPRSRGAPGPFSELSGEGVLGSSL